MPTVNIERLRKLDYRCNEAYKTLRTNIQLCGSDMKVIMFTSSTPNEGKSSVSFNLAVSLAESGKKVIFIDADLRKSVLVGRYKINKAIKGLTHFLSGMNKFEEVICTTNVDNLYVVFSGIVPPNPSELLANNSFDALVKALRDTYDYVIIDTAPALSSLSVNALVASDLVVIPAVLGDFCDLASRDVLNTIDTVRQQNKKLAVAGILITMSKKRYVLDRLVAEQYQRLADSKHIRLFTSKIRQCQKVKEAQMLKISLLEYAPRCNAALDYRNFVNELLEL